MKITKHYLINEAELSKLPVIYSEDIKCEIDYIKEHNQFEKEGLSRLFLYIKGIEKHISNRAIAFGYGNNYRRNYDDSVLVNEYGAIFRVVDGTDRTFVEIVWIDLNLEDFGLQENRNINISRIVTEAINSYLKKNLLLAS